MQTNTEHLSIHSFMHVATRNSKSAHVLTASVEFAALGTGQALQHSYSSNEQSDARVLHAALLFARNTPPTQAAARRAPRGPPRGTGL